MVKKQRAAVARAIITEPEILLADEPTGALDSKSSAALLDVFDEINERGQTILMVTHQPQQPAGPSAFSLSRTAFFTTKSTMEIRQSVRCSKKSLMLLTVMASEVN